MDHLKVDVCKSMMKVTAMLERFLHYKAPSTLDAIVELSFSIYNLSDWTVAYADLTVAVIVIALVDPDVSALFAE